METYNLIHQFEHNSNYKNINLEQNNNLADLVHNNIEKMDKNEMRILLNKCYSKDFYKKHLLIYEFKNLNLKPTNDTFENFIKIAKKYLLRYNYVVGGYQLQDKQFRFYNYLTTDYNLKLNEIYFENTVHKNLIDQKLKNYLERLVSILNSINKKVKVKYSIKQKNNTNWVLIHCVFKPSKINKIKTYEISL